MYIGPHTASLTNMLWTTRASVIEFPTKPEPSPLYKALAAMTGTQYHTVPELSSTYYEQYTADQPAIDACMLVVTAVARARGVPLAKDEL